MYGYLEEEALDVAQGSQAAGWLLYRQVRARQTLSLSVTLQHARFRRPAERGACDAGLAARLAARNGCERAGRRRIRAAVGGAPCIGCGRWRGLGAAASHGAHAVGAHASVAHRRVNHMQGPDGRGSGPHACGLAEQPKLSGLVSPCSLSGPGSPSLRATPARRAAAGQQRRDRAAGGRVCAAGRAANGPRGGGRARRGAPDRRGRAHAPGGRRARPARAPGPAVRPAARRVRAGPSDYRRPACVRRCGAPVRAPPAGQAPFRSRRQ